MKTYKELLLLPTFKERFEFLKLEDGYVGRDIFGHQRFLNQQFYSSPDWKRIRSFVISRDLGNDMALDGYPIMGKIIVHHMNPLEPIDFLEKTDKLLNPDYFICVSLRTHNAIHYGTFDSIDQTVNERRKDDTLLWKRVVK